MRKHTHQGTAPPDPRQQELLWPARQHPADQRNALFVEGFRMERIRLLPNSKAQVVIEESQRPDRGDDVDHDETRERYEQYIHPKSTTKGDSNE